MSKEKIPDFPEHADGEGAYQVARTTIGAADLAVPFVGQALQYVLDRYVGAPLENRREEWFRLVGQKLQELSDRPQGFDLEALAGNEEFVSTVADATQAAMRTHREAKREALANAVANAAAGYQIDEVLRGSFISYVDRFSTYHLQVLRALDCPSLDRTLWRKAEEILRENHTGVSLDGLRTTSSSDPVLARVISDLAREELVDPALNTVGTNPGELGRKATPVGQDFLRFIGPPR